MLGVTQIQAYAAEMADARSSSDAEHPSLMLCAYCSACPCPVNSSYDLSARKKVQGLGNTCVCFAAELRAEPRWHVCDMTMVCM